MEWSRAKTILIIFLFVVNIFLFGTYMKKENETGKDMLRLRHEVSVVLANQGINVVEEEIPSDEVEIRHATVAVADDGAILAESLFGEVEETESSGNKVYSGKNGNIMFLNDSFSLVYESGQEITSAEEAEALAKSLARKLSLSYSGGKITTESTVGGYRVKIPQVFGGVEIFGAEGELNISKSGNVLGNGKFIAKGRLVRAEGRTMSVSSLLLEFASFVVESGRENVTIEAMRCGYTAKTPAGGSVYLVPTLEISTDSGKVYMNMSDGSVIGI